MDPQGFNTWDVLVERGGILDRAKVGQSDGDMLMKFKLLWNLRG